MSFTVQPRLIHPVPIVIEQVDEANTNYDDHHREPIQQSKRKTSVTIKGQVRWAVPDDVELQITIGGKQIQADGYVLFRFKDLTAASVTLKENDRFISIGGETVDVYIVKFRPMGHYPRAGGPTLVRAYFMDRTPIRSQGLDLS
jgi:hypothetical protein